VNLQSHEITRIFSYFMKSLVSGFFAVTYIHALSMCACMYMCTGTLVIAKAYVGKSAQCDRTIK